METWKNLKKGFTAYERVSGAVIDAGICHINDINRSP